MRHHRIVADNWTLSASDVKDGEWFQWNLQVAEERPDLATAVSEFEAYSKNAAAAKEGTNWFRDCSVELTACVTRILVTRGHIAAFYALSSGEAVITSEKYQAQMGGGGARFGSSHVEWIARDRRAPAGAGDKALRHAIYIAILVSDLQGNAILTLDPFDSETQAMWRQKGLRNSQTEDDDGQLKRLYLPIIGPYLGPFDRGVREDEG
jgi:hypothetical protein